MNMNNKTEFQKKVDQIKTKYLDLWWNSKCDFPNIVYLSTKDRLINERNGTKFKEEILKELRQISDNKGMSVKDELKNKIYTLLNELKPKIKGYDISYIDYFINKGYSDITEAFIKEVKEFDSTIDTDDIFQAIRNVWIMNSIQILFGLDVKLTPSIFAYSMLYPYSDNYLDNTSIPLEDKVAFNRKFKKWLSGGIAEPSNYLEKKIFKLVNKIEYEFSRNNFSDVFDSLLSIHIAQERSLMQQKGISFPYERDILGISFEKGGTSVLADGYLVKGKLTEEETDFMFGYGVFLQLVDDLQDSFSDYNNGHMTIFSQILNKWPLDNMTNKLFWFIDETLNKSTIFTSSDALKLKKIIHESCIIMIFEAISKNKKYYSKKYIKKIEEYSMFRFSYFKKLKRSIKKDFSSKDFDNLIYLLSE